MSLLTSNVYSSRIGSEMPKLGTSRTRQRSKVFSRCLFTWRRPSKSKRYINSWWREKQAILERRLVACRYYVDRWCRRHYSCEDLVNTRDPCIPWDTGSCTRRT